MCINCFFDMLARREKWLGPFGFNRKADCLAVKFRKAVSAIWQPKAASGSDPWAYKSSFSTKRRSQKSRARRKKGRRRMRKHEIANGFGEERNSIALGALCLIVAAVSSTPRTRFCWRRRQISRRTHAM